LSPAPCSRNDVTRAQAVSPINTRTQRYRERADELKACQAIFGHWQIGNQEAVSSRDQLGPVSRPLALARNASGSIKGAIFISAAGLPPSRRNFSHATYYDFLMP
jgi:hypothetical protein